MENNIIEYGITLIGMGIIMLIISQSSVPYYNRLCRFLEINNQKKPKLFTINSQQILDFTNATLNKMNPDRACLYKNKINFNLLLSKKFNLLKISFFLIFFSFLINLLILMISFISIPDFHYSILLIIEIIFIMIMIIINLPMLKTMYYCNKVSKEFFTKV